MSLQSLTIRRPDDWHVHLRDGEMLELSVADDGAGFDGDGVPQGRGIDNTRERLRALYGPPASLTITRAPTGGTTATLRVPWREIVLESDVAEG